jgi:pimeloyl-ACP methyl ester carboxylesterase
LKHPELVRSLTLAEAPVARLVQNTEQGRIAFDEMMEKLWKPTGDAFRRGDKEGALRTTLDYFLGQGVSSQVPVEVLQGLRDNLPEWEALTTRKDAYPNLSREDLRRLRVPVLMLSGEKTLSLLKLVDAELQTLIRGVERKIIPNATHDMWNEEPEICGNAVLEFVGKY